MANIILKTKRSNSPDAKTVQEITKPRIMQMKTAETSTWITNELTEEERYIAEFIADIAVSIQKKT